MPVGFYSSLALLPLRGKPLIWWQLDNLQKQGLSDYILVVCKDNNKLVEYVKNVLSQTFSIKLVKVGNKKNILSSLKYGLQKANPNLPTRVILGDTMLTQSIDNQVDTLFTSIQITSSEEWCLVEKLPQKKLYFYDKVKKLDIKDKEALVGYYSFSDTKYLLNCCVKARLMLKQEISTALIMYQEKYLLKTNKVSDWYDLGHTSGLIKVKNILFSARDFNSISVDTKVGTLTKTSTKIQKLEDEAFWYKMLPEDLKILTPRLINFKKDKNIAHLTQELYGYPSLQELFLSGNVNIEDWRYIIEKLFSLHKELEKYTIPNDEKALVWLYFDKTKERIEELIKQSDYWKKLLAKDYLVVNSKKLLGIEGLKKQIEVFSKKLAYTKFQTIVHGDYCFSNILFDSSNYTFKLIDPRGRLNAEPTIYGDARYDIAKLRHSICGLYDFVVQGLFHLEKVAGGYEYKILTNRDYSDLEKIFDKEVKKNNFDVKEIKFIEGLLFLSMIPLHKDNQERQTVFYLKSLELLNDVVASLKE